MTRHWFVLLLSFVFLDATLALAEDGPSKDVPELQVLANYIGTWDVTITSNDSPFTKGEATTKWILDGRFAEQSGQLALADGKSVIRVKTLMTYDEREKSYRMWSFLSNGSTSTASGKWDAQSRTMTSVSRSGDTTTTTTAKFSDNGIEEWAMVTTNQNNDVVGRFSGQNTRRKP